MILIKNVKRLDGTIHDVKIESESTEEIDAGGKLLMLPALIDPHVHFRVPGFDYKEDWISGAEAAVQGGVTTVFDMPNNEPPCCSLDSYEHKKEIIDRELKSEEIPLRYYLYLGVSPQNFGSIGKLKKKAVALKAYLGGSFGTLALKSDKEIEEAFRLAAQENMILAVHLEDHALLEENKKKYQADSNPDVHGKIYSKEMSIKALERSLDLSERYNTHVLFLQVSTKEEIALIRQAKKAQLSVYCEVTPQHLFLTEKDYLKEGTRLKVVPPLRSQEDQDALWGGIQDGTVDFIGSAHSPHTLEEKSRSYHEASSGVPAIETMLPLLLNAYHQKKITLEKIVQLTHLNIEDIFSLQRNFDCVLVDLELEKKVDEASLKTKNKWSPYANWTLKGWPVYTIVQGKVFRLR